MFAVLASEFSIDVDREEILLAHSCDLFLRFGFGSDITALRYRDGNLLPPVSLMKISGGGWLRKFYNFGNNTIIVNES